MSFDKIFDLTAGACFNFYNNMTYASALFFLLQQREVMGRAVVFLNTQLNFQRCLVLCLD